MTKLIAIIDDEEEMAEIYPLIFQKHLGLDKLEIKFFNESQLFLDWLQTNEPDLCMIDIEMPKISGPELLRKSKNSLKNIPTYFVSGHNAVDYEKEMQELNITRFLTKPFDIADLVRSVTYDLNL